MTRFGRIATLSALVATSGVALVVMKVRDRNKETMWALWADVHNMAVSEVAFYMDNARYSTDLSDRYHPTHGATVTITSASDTSWAATATHPRTRKVCTIAYSERRGATYNEVVAARVAAMQGFACR
jgi:hypothetical protein